MRADLEFTPAWVRDDVRGCKDCRAVDGSQTIYDVCGWHENLVAAAAWQIDIIERLVKGDDK